jgi:hypothetical protein
MDINKIKEWVLNQDVGSAVYWTSLAFGVAVIVVASLVVRHLIRSIRQGDETERNERTLKFIFLLALAINADAMLRVAMDKLHLAWWFAGGVFFFFEVLQWHFMKIGKARYKVDKTTGNAAVIVWFVALASSVITLFNSHNPVEALIRIILPVTVATVWYLNLVAGQRPTVGRFRYSPHRVMVTLGWMEPDEDVDYERVTRERKIRKLVTLSHKIEQGGWLVKYRTVKLKRAAITTPVDVLEAAAAQLQAGRRAIKALVPELPEERSKTDVEINSLLDQFRDVPEQVRGAGTSGTGTQVRGAGTQVSPTGTSGTDSSGTTGTGTQVSGTGTDTDPDQVRAWMIISYMDEHGLDAMPPTIKLREICATRPGGKCNQDVAIRARNLAVDLINQRTVEINTEE